MKWYYMHAGMNKMAMRTAYYTTARKKVITEVTLQGTMNYTHMHTYSETCLERPPVLTDHVFSAEGPTFQ